MKNTNTINAQTLRTLLFGFVGSFQFKLAPTEIKLRKRDGERLQGMGIEKLYKVVDGWRTGIVGQRYQDSVRSEETMEAVLEGKTVEEQFLAVAPPNRIKFVEGSVVISTNQAGDAEYVAMRLTGQDPVYYMDQSGKIWEKEEIEFALPAKSTSSRQRQENKVIWITPKLENFRGAIINGKEFKVAKV